MVIIAVTPTFHISKGSHRIGPCTLSEVRAFLAYGSITMTDLLLPCGESEWRTVEEQFKRLAEEKAAYPTEPGAFYLFPRRRVFRYRDPASIPHSQRAETIITWTILGATVFPPLLWKAALSVFSNRIFTRQADDNGYLRHWSRLTEAWLAMLLLVNSLLVLVVIGIVWDWCRPVITDVTNAFQEGLRSVNALF